MPAVQACKMLGYLVDLSERFDFLTVRELFRYKKAVKAVGITIAFWPI
jgi:hypothetical protein